MSRADISSLTEEDLVRAANAGLVKRARRELGDSSLTADVSEKSSDLVVRWSDGVTCRFPPGSSFRGTCSCPATDLCRHLVRSILYLQSHPELTAGSAANETTNAHPTIDMLLAADDATIQSLVGKASLERARRSLGAEIVGEVVDPAKRMVAFPQLGVEIRFPEGAHLGSAICTCDERSPCSHVLPAILVLRGEKPTEESSGLTDEAIQEALKRAKRLLHELAAGGIDRLSPAWPESAQTTALEIRKANLNVPAELLEELARQVSAEQRRDAPFQIARLRWALAALWLRVCGPLQQRMGEDLIALPRQTFWTGGRRRLTGIGIRAWSTERIAGISLFLMDEQTGEIVTTGTGRPRDMEIPASQLASHAMLLGTATARELMGRQIECSSTRLTGQGKLRLPTGVDCRLLNDAVDWTSIVDAHGLSRWRDLAERLRTFFPTILTRRKPLVHWFRPTAFGEPTVDSAHQTFVWPMLDLEGKELHLQYLYLAERAEAFEQLKLIAEGEPPFALLGQLRWGGGSLRVEPITFLRKSDCGLTSFVIDVDTLGSRKKRVSR